MNAPNSCDQIVMFNYGWGHILFELMTSAGQLWTVGRISIFDLAKLLLLSVCL